LSDISVLNYKRNDSLVFDAAGKCILSLHSMEDLRTSGEHHAVKSRGSSKGKKRSPQSLQDSEVPPMKKRRKIIEESEDEDDNEPLGKGKASPRPDESMEGGCFSLPDATGN
jgi:hypothetical protein